MRKKALKTASARTRVSPYNRTVRNRRPAIKNNNVSENRRVQPDDITPLEAGREAAALAAFSRMQGDENDLEIVDPPASATALSARPPASRGLEDSPLLQRLLRGSVLAVSLALTALGALLSQPTLITAATALQMLLKR
jgi:hypothetical protein